MSEQIRFYYGNDCFVPVPEKDEEDPCRDCEFGAPYDERCQESYSETNFSCVINKVIWIKENT